MQNHSWPPEILYPYPPLQDHQFMKMVRKGISAVVLAGIGIFVNLVLMQDSFLFEKGTLGSPVHGFFVFMSVGIGCNSFGLLLGIFSRKTAVGKIGLILSFLALMALPIVIFAAHAHNGIWPWGSDDDCGCP